MIDLHILKGFLEIAVTNPAVIEWVIKFFIAYLALKNLFKSLFKGVNDSLKALKKVVEDMNTTLSNTDSTLLEKINKIESEIKELRERGNNERET